MTLIEERALARRPPCPCVQCGDTWRCEGESSRMQCAVYRYWQSYPRNAYKRHLRWMEEKLAWTSKPPLRS